MIYSRENLKFAAPSNAKVRLIYLKLDLLRMDILKQSLPKGMYRQKLNNTITERRVIING